MTIQKRNIYWQIFIGAMSTISASAAIGGWVSIQNYISFKQATQDDRVEVHAKLKVDEERFDKDEIREDKTINKTYDLDGRVSKLEAAK